MKAEFHPATSEEIIEISAYYESQVPGLGMGFTLEIEQMIDVLCDQPKIGQRIKKEFRRLPLSRFPYSLIYLIEPELIWVVAAAHQHRRPGYWQKRTKD